MPVAHCAGSRGGNCRCSRPQQAEGHPRGRGRTFCRPSCSAGTWGAVATAFRHCSPISKNARLTTACAMSTHRPGGKWGSAARTVPRQTGKSARHASTGHALRPVQRQADDRRNRPLKPWWCTAGLSFADPHALRRRLPGPLSALCTTILPNRRDTSVCALGHDRRTRRLPVLRRNGRVSRRTCAMPCGV